MWSDYFPDYYGGFGNASAPWNESTGTGGGVNSSDNSFGPTIPNGGWNQSVAQMLAPYNPTWPQYDPSNPSGPIYFPWPDPGGGGGAPFPPIFIEPFPTVYPGPPEPPDPETNPSQGTPQGQPENPNQGSGEAYRVPQTGGTRVDTETGRPTLTLPNEGPGPSIGGQIPGRGSVDWRVPAAVGSAGAAIGAIIAGQGSGQGPVTQPQPPAQPTDPSVPPVVPPPTPPAEPPPTGPVIEGPKPEEPGKGRGGPYVPSGPVLAPRWPVEYKPPTAGPPPVLEEPIIPPPVLPPVTDPNLPPPATETPIKLPNIPGLSGIVAGGSGAPLPGPFAPLVGSGPTQSVFQNTYRPSPVPSIGELLSQFAQIYGGR